MSHNHNLALKVNIPEGAKKIVFAGNPNVGKSVFFNAFTGAYVDVSNFPGTTLEILHGAFETNYVIDTPGVYGISSFNDEERIARDVILSADIVINIVDAVHLERDLFLTQQIIDTGKPVIVALNMMDEAKARGIKIDVDLLSDLLGVPVIPTVAVTKQGIDELKKSLHSARKGNVDHNLLSKLKLHLDRVGDQGEALLILEGDEIIAKRHGVSPGSDREEIYLARRHRVNDIVSHVVTDTNQGMSFSTRLGRWMLKPSTGIPILLLCLYTMYQLIGVFVAGTIVGITEEAIMIEMYEPRVIEFVTRFVAEDSVLGILLVGEFGLLTMTFTYVLGLLMPLVIGFYMVLSVFEDSGYMPRIAALMDRVMTGLGLNGRAVIPMILGFGCVTMAIITTRLLGSDRERRIAIFLLGLAIPCSAQLGVIAGLLSGVGGAYLALYVAVIISVLLSVGTVLNMLLKGKSSPLLIDLPPLRIPRVGNVLKKTVTKSYMFLKEAFPLFALGALIITSLQLTGILDKLQELLSPLTVGILGLPAESATAFIMGIVRRDFGAAGLNDMALDPMQTTVALITITLFVPCIASIIIMFKERSKGEAALMWFGSWVIAFVVGGLVAKLLTLMASFNLDETATILVTIGVFLLVTVVVGMLNKIKSSTQVNIKG